MSQNSPYLDELKLEISKFDPEEFPHVCRLLNEEIKRVDNGDKYKYVTTIDLSNDRPCSCAVKVRIPVKEFPKFNFVGKLLGPKGNTLKRLQEETGCKLSILGRGSIRDKNKEEELRKEGGKYAHLHEELHVLIECFTEPTDGYGRLSHAVTEVKKFMIPDSEDDIAMQQMQEMMYINQNNGENKGGPMGGRGRGRGGPPSLLGGRGGLLNTPAGQSPRGGRGAPGGVPGRGAPGGRGAPVGRGAPRGGRGAPRGRGSSSMAPPIPAAPHRAEPAYDDYGSGMGGGYEEPYQESYDQSYGQESYDDGYGGGQTGGYGQEAGDGYGDTQYFDYGHGTQSYDDYGSQSAGSGGYGASSLKSPRGGGRGGQYRSHPYGGQGGRGSNY